MKTLSVICSCLALLALGMLAAQSSAPSQPSLGELARRFREQKDAQPPAGKAKRVYDNQTIPHDPNAAWHANAAQRDIEPGTGSDKSADAKSDKSADAKKDGKDAKKDSKSDAKKEAGKGEDEQVWRGRFAKLRETLNTETRRLDVLQRELGLAQKQSYDDPNQAMREQFARTELTKRTAEIEAQKQVVEGAKKAISDLEEEARLKGVPPAWMQP